MRFNLNEVRRVEPKKEHPPKEHPKREKLQRILLMTACAIVGIVFLYYLGLLITAYI